jgi:proline iminopeptidase
MECATAVSARSGSIQAGASTLRYKVEGSGTPVLVPGSATYYPRTFSRALRRVLTLAFTDLRHFAEATPGGPAVPVADLDLDTYLEDMDRLRDAVGFHRCVVLGHSHHGCLALEYAKRYPERVTHVVMVGAPPVGVRPTMEAGEAYWVAHASEERKAVLRRNGDALAPDVLAKMSPAEAVVARYVAAGPRYWRDPTYDASWLWRDVPMDMDALAAFKELFVSYQATWDPARLQAPVLVVMGRHDYVVPPTLWDDALPGPGVVAGPGNVTYRVLEKSGHTPQLEEPRAFDELLLEWLWDQPAPPARRPGGPATRRPGGSGTW